jgi:hypothetical protein
MGKSVRDLHDRLIKVVDAERSKTKGADYLGRLTRELLEFPEYVNPLAILSIEVYSLNLPLLLHEDVLTHTTSTPIISERNYKTVICGKKNKGQHCVFIKEFISVFVKKYC